MSKFNMIPCVDASDFPNEVELECIRTEIPVHHHSAVEYIWKDRNPLLFEWLLSIGIKETPDGYINVAIVGS